MLFGQNPLLALKGTDRCDILGEFQRPHITASCIPHGEITDIDEFILDVNPEIFGILHSGFEISQQLLNNMHTLRRMAVLYGAADNGLRPGEDPFLAMREVADDIVLVDKGQIHRQMIHQRLELV